MIKDPSELQERLRQESNAQIRFKLAFLQCIAHLKSDLDTLCQAFGIATLTGYWWLRNWNQSGYAGLQESPGGNAGRPPQLDDVDLDYLSQLLKEKACWTTPEIRELIKVTFGVEHSPGQVVRILRKRLNMHFGKPFPHDYRRPVHAGGYLERKTGESLYGIETQRLKKAGYCAGFCG